jgi:hypothetical protein
MSLVRYGIAGGMRTLFTLTRTDTNSAGEQLYGFNNEPVTGRTDRRGITISTSVYITERHIDLFRFSWFWSTLNSFGNQVLMKGEEGLWKGRSIHQ